MSEQIVDLLEPVEVEAEHGALLPACHGGGDLVIEPRMERAAVRQRGQRIMMREIADVLLGLLARLQVAHGDDVMRMPREVDRTQDQFDRNHRSIGVTKIGLDRLVWRGEQFRARAGVRTVRVQVRTDQLVRR